MSVITKWELELYQKILTSTKSHLIIETFIINMVFIIELQENIINVVNIYSIRV